MTRNQNMQAVIATGGKQYRVEPGSVIEVERLGSPKGAAVEFDRVLLVNQDGDVTVEPGALASARVTGEVLATRKSAKVMVVKFKRRKNYRRHRGHRQTMTVVRITNIEV
jgi:large subunit ribosomal protein L21